MVCKYHIILAILYDTVCERIHSKYNWQLFDYWLGDDSNLARRYVESFQEIIEAPLTQEQKLLLEKKGQNLEKMIAKWRLNWKNNHPNLPNDELPETCLYSKILEYMTKQLLKDDLKALIIDYC
jgi:hypothetical protein